MKPLVPKVDLAFIFLIITVIIRQFCYRDTDASFRETICAFTFHLFNFNIAIQVICLFGLFVPLAVLYFVFYDIKRQVYPLATFNKDVLLHHVFYCFIAGCFLYCVDIFQDFLRESKETIKSYNVWYKYIFHFILTPALFVDSVYTIEIQKLVQSGAIELKALKNRIYYISQTLISIYLIYSLFVVLYIEGQLKETVYCVLELRSPDYPSEFSNYLKNLSNSAIECVFLILFFGLLDQGVIIKRLAYEYTQEAQSTVKENIGE